MAFQSRNQRFRRVVPYLNRAVIGSCEKVWFIGLRVVVDMIYTLGLVGFEGRVGVWGAQTPDLNGSIQTSGCECVCILGVDRQAHYVVAVSLKHLNAFPVLLPIPQFDCHVIRCGKNERLSGVDCDRTNVVGVSLEGRDLLGGVIVVDAQLEVIRSANNPVLAGNEATGSYGDIGELECFNYGLSENEGLLVAHSRSPCHLRDSPGTRKTRCKRDLFMFLISAFNGGTRVLRRSTHRYTRWSGSNIQLAKNENQWLNITYPWLRGMEVNALYPLGAGKELSLLSRNNC